MASLQEYAASNSLKTDALCPVWPAGAPGGLCGLRPAPEMCGNSAEEAMSWLEWLEGATQPDHRHRSCKKRGDTHRSRRKRMADEHTSEFDAG